MLLRQCDNKAEFFKQMIFILFKFIIIKIYFIRYDKLVKTNVFSYIIFCYNMIAGRHVYSSNIVFYNFILYLINFIICESIDKHSWRDN